MKVLIAGAGRTGNILIKELKENKNDVAVMDLSEERCKEISEEFDVLVFKGDVTDIDDLSNINIKEYAVLISVTGDDEKNILGCLLAKEFGMQKVIARVSDPRLSKIATKLGITHTICPEEAAAEKIINIIKESAPMELPESLGVRVVKLTVSKDAPMVGKRIRDLPLTNEWMILRIKDKSGRYLPFDASFRIQPEYTFEMIIKEGSVEAVKALFI
ncbi:MAG: potassium channel family protein [Candidatus Methanomethylicaceae archaeon]